MNFDGMTEEQSESYLKLQTELIKAYEEHGETLRELNRRTRNSILMWTALNDFQDELWSRWPFIPKFAVKFDITIQGLRYNDELTEALMDMGEEMETW